LHGNPACRRLRKKIIHVRIIGRKMGTTNTALRRVIMHEKQIKLIAYASIIALWLV